MPPGERREIKVWIDGARKLDPAGAGVTFTSNDTSVATVSSAGIILAMGVGNTSIIVKYGNKTATVSVAVQ